MSQLQQRPARVGQAAILDGLRVVDADSHVTEPPDVWTSRVPRALAERVPRVELNPATGHHHWRIGERWLTPVAAYGRAGWGNYPPDGPNEYEDIDPATWRAADRLARLDDFGIYAQVLHPNLIAQEIGPIMDAGLDVAGACVQAYNDFIAEFAAADPDRLLPVAMVPFWDLEAAVAEVRRAGEAGHHGILFGNDYTAHGLPYLTDRHWDPVYAAAQEMGLPVLVHVGFCEKRGGAAAVRKTAATYQGAAVARDSSISLMRNAELLAHVVTSGLCDRFPELRFVSVESGVGYINYLLESLDWNWHVHGVHRTSPLLPSEYFARQCYATFWFERETLRLLDTYPDNFVFQTDFPHQNGQAPGPVSPGERPASYLARELAAVDPAVTRKVLQDNAVALYGLR